MSKKAPTGVPAAPTATVCVDPLSIGSGYVSPQPWDLLKHGSTAKEIAEMQRQRDEILRQLAAQQQNQINQAINPYLVGKLSPSPQTHDKELGTFQITKVGGGFVVKYLKDGRVDTHIAADLDKLRDLIVSELISNQLER